MNHTLAINEYTQKLIQTIEALDRKELGRFVDLLLDAYEREAHIFIFGNGGSGATASHFASDLNKECSYGLDKRFKVIALTDNMPILLAYANDCEYSDIFVEQLKNFIRPGDLVIGISGSGNSENVLKAIKFAKAMQCTTVGITGYDGGRLRQIAEYSVNANVADMQISEDIHMILNHLTVKLLKQALERAPREAK